MGEAGLEQLLKATINTAVSIKAVKLEELERVIVDTTVQDKAIAHPVDSRLKRVVKRQRSILGVDMREVQRRCAAAEFTTDNPLALTELKMWLERAERIRTQQRHDKNKLYALHAPEVECIGKDKARKPYEFGVKNAVLVSHKQGLMLGARTFPGNPYDGHILSAVLEQATNLTQDLSITIRQVVADLGFRGKEVDADNRACKSFTGAATRA